MKLALNSATFIKLLTLLSEFVSTSVQCSFPNDRWRSSPFVTTKFTHHFFNCYFLSWKLHLVVFHLFQIGMQELYMLWHTRETSIAIQSQWYTRPSGFLTRSSDQSESSQVNQTRRSIFLSSYLLPSLCVRNVLASFP